MPMAKRDEPPRKLSDVHRLLLVALFDPRLCRGDVAVFGAILSSCYDEQSVSWLGPDKLAKVAKVSRATVFRNLQALKETGWIAEVGKRPNGKTNIHRPTWERRDGLKRETVSPMRPMRQRMVSSGSPGSLIQVVGTVSSMTPEAVALDATSEAQQLCASAHEEQRLQQEQERRDGMRRVYIEQRALGTPRGEQFCRDLERSHPQLVADLIQQPPEAA
jgi:hypothetical protein